MEAFLSTLPPYVHKFLDKYPPTDVFNLLRELICFAVLYSEDRERIKAATEEFLAKRENEEIEQEEDKEEDKEEQEQEEEEEEEIEQQVPIQHNSIIVPPKEPSEEKKQSKMPNTFPEWWGHQEFEPPEKKPLTKTASLWVSLDHEEKQIKRASSQVVIPNLRSYIEPTSSPKQKTVKEEQAKPAAAKSPARSPQRSPSVIKPPKQTAAVRARAEHAKQLQQELLQKKKVAETSSSPTSQRLKQRVNSGIDWDTIKKDRRKTVATATLSEHQK
ncbi:hypothetical protein BCV72DRAFT_123549 [Rhizopus microsporus var. microsporus]|uniref:Uncharacterized protein n=2 Tax=Rhizopus microsporus TaxID=58291 RepID=A0A2G4SH30_RHIZD|nr:uncharacterized protein RHIMIDRAFT_80564 [Rhizopus microsporus ATCC 52813]ORE06463.1 hypothetical protein BCV72DRAFT_123549 [Rhizopus microsporus var. microsporus]PHZ08069.1 hypothetical protein RHIMIDRAFT_80564 [Rhizopus microsporus ATCC 52813]